MVGGQPPSRSGIWRTRRRRSKRKTRLTRPASARVAFDDAGVGGTTLTNTTEGTALLLLRRMTRAARTAVSPRTLRPATHRTRLPGQAPRVPALALAALALAALALAALATPALAQTVVPADWSLKPTGVAAGAKFRLLFLSSTTRDATATDIATYNTFIQTRAAAGHTDIQAYSAGFRVVGCTAAVDARDNTSTTYTTADTGVPIYWLNGTKAADQYEDFYDGSWDDEASDKNESGTDGPDTSQLANQPWTGCGHDGTEEVGYPLGNTLVQAGRPASSTSGDGPISSGDVNQGTNTRPMYGLSEVFQVPAAPTEVPAAWSLKPTDVAAGAKFRLLFLSSTKRDATATDIATYNTFVQDRAAAGHADIQAYSAGFRVVGCTADTDATANTGTTGTGVPIYWLNGAKAADDYADFYDGDWDDEANDKNESGTDGPDTSQSANRPWTGCNHNGTKSVFSGTPRALGSVDVRVGQPNTSTADNGPISSNTARSRTETRPMYGLSEVFQVGANTAPGAPTGLTATASGTSTINLSWTAPASNGGSAITGYKIEVSPNGTSSWTDLQADTASTTTTYAHRRLAGGTTRHYRVSAINSIGTSLPSNVDSATTDADTTPPTLTDAGVYPAGEGMTLTFSEDLQEFTLPPASAFTVTADGSAVTVSIGTHHSSFLATFSILVSPLIRQGQTVVVTYTDPSTGDDTNAIQDISGNDAASFTTGVSGVPAVVNDSDVAAVAPANWSLKPTGLASGDKFRLLFLSSTTRNATATDIADYNTFVQTRAAAGHADIQTYSAGFRVVGCTAAVDARDNTETTYTSTTKGVPIYWLNGAKAADQYEDFYDGSWDDEANDKNESGTDGPDTSVTAGLPRTGCEHNGTEAFLGQASRALGNSSARVGRPNSSNTNNGPLSSGNVSNSTDTRPMYGLSALFQVGANSAPGAPTGLTATASGTTRINLSWTAPGDGGSAITGYKIEVSPNGTSSWTDLVADTGTTATTYEHTGLTAGTTRHYRVSAINSIGTSATASDVANTTTDAATATAPGAPTGLTATASGPSTINLSWTAPASNGGSAITGYKIEVSSDSGSNWTDQVANTGNANTAYADSGLAASTTRHYRVYAINGIGTSTHSNVANATTGAATTDDCAADTTTTCSVSPAATPGGVATGNLEHNGDVDRFSFSVTSGVEYQIDVEGAATSKGSLADPNFALLDSIALIADDDDGGTGLNARLVWTADRTGTVYAQITSAGGSGGTYTLTVTVRGAATNAPGAPTGLTATASGPSTITLSWTAPTSTGGSAITGYQIEASSNGGTTFNVLVADTGNATTTYAHTGLAASTTRHYRVSAINSTGTSATASNVASATTGAATNAPGAPTGLTATASGPSTINLSWTAPASTGGSAITGYKIEISPDGITDWTDLVANNATTTYAHTTNLMACLTRYYRVSAINATATGPVSTVAFATTEADGGSCLLLDFGTASDSYPVKVVESRGTQHRFVLSLRTRPDAGPDGNPQAAGDDPAAGEARGRRDAGRLRGAAGERDVRGGRERGRLRPARVPGPDARDRRGPADRLRRAAGRHRQGRLGAVRNGGIRGRPGADPDDGGRRHAGPDLRQGPEQRLVGAGVRLHRECGGGGCQR